MEDDEGRSQGTFRYTVQNIRNLKDAVLSPPCYVCKLPWKIMAGQYPRNLPYLQQQKCLGFFLQCNGESQLSTWSCYAQAELRLISHTPNCEAFIRRIQHLFHSEENDWGFAHFIPWNDVLNPEKGYFKDDAITLEVHVTAEAAHGVSWTPKILDLPKLSSYKTRKRKVQKVKLTTPIKEQKKATNKKKKKANVSLRLRSRKVSKAAKNTNITAQAPHGVSGTPRNVPDMPKLSPNKTTRKIKVQKVKLTTPIKEQKKATNKKKKKANVSLRLHSRKVSKAAKNTNITAQAPHGVSGTPRNVPDMPKLSPNKTTRKIKVQKAELTTAIKEQQKEEQNATNKKKKETSVSLSLRSRKVGETATITKKMASGKTKKTKNKKTTRDPKYFCLVCGDPYVEPLEEDWIQCGDCGQWAHESCTSYEGRGSYFCDLCHE